MVGEVCEGLYARDVGGRPLVVVALTSSVDEFASTDSTDLTLDWAAQAGAPIHLRAEALRPRLYYRMDAALPAATASLRWSPRLLKTLGLTRRELGLLAWTEQRIGGELRRVLTPLRLSLSLKSMGPDALPWQLVVLPADELDELYLSVTPVDANGIAGAPLVADRALGRGFYPASRPVSIELPRLAGAGLYRVDLAAALRSGGSATDSAWVRGDGR